MYAKHNAYSTEPAERWEYANVTGNGEMGAMHFGLPHKEKVVVNHAELFLPADAKQDMPDMSDCLEIVRRISRNEGYLASHEFFIKKGEERGHTIVHTDSFHPGFFLEIDQAPVGTIEDYFRSVDFSTGEIISSWIEGKVEFKRKLFASRPDKMIVMSITSNEPIPLVALRMEEINHPGMEVSIRYENDMIISRHLYTKGRGGYDSFVKISPIEGEIVTDPNQMTVSGANEILVMMKIVPFAEGSQTSLENFEELDGNYKELIASHINVHGALFNRVSLDLDGGEKRSWSTDELLAAVRNEKEVSMALVEKLFDAGRYMFISSTGLRPPNLQGIWTGTWNPSWSSDYTLDTNLQLAMASVFSGNMMEGMKPFVTLIESFLEDFRYNARMLFGCRGILSGIRASTSGKHLHWGDSSWGDRECDTFFGAFWTCGAGWLAHWFYDYYLYTGDQEFLKDHTVPLLKEVVQFYEDFLYEDQEGSYMFNPSYSAENGIAANSTQDIAVAKEVLTHLIDSCQLLGVEEKSIPKWRNMIEKLPPYLINEEGALKEWAVWDHEDNYNHRHFSHLYPLFQSYEFSEEKTPELWEASNIALQKKMEHWLYNPSTDTSSHGRMHAGLAAARLGMGDTVWDILRMMAAGGAIYPSLMTAHYDEYNVFNVDANGSIPELIHNLLLFSLPGKIELLHALPTVVTRGKITGTCCRGQIYVNSFEWDLEKRHIELTITSEINQEIVISLFRNNEEWSLLGELNHPNEWKIALTAGKPCTLRWK